MITIERLQEIIDNKKPYQIKGKDHIFTAISLLRERIPYEVCPGIIEAAEHDIIYLCDVECALPYLSEEDAEMLGECNIGIDKELDCFYHFV